MRGDSRVNEKCYGAITMLFLEIVPMGEKMLLVP
jgi:hypothetical protein